MTPSVEEKIGARRVLVALAKRASKGQRPTPVEWIRSIKQSHRSLVEIVGSEEFEHIVKWAWSLP